MTDHRIRAANLDRWATTAQRTATATASPCPCPDPECPTIGDHVWRATRDGRPGIRAATLDPGHSTGHPGLQLPQPDRDGTARAHDELRRTIGELERHTNRLHDLIGAWRPDRERATQAASSDDWCRHHLELIGTCEPRYRGDRCRWCYDFHATNAVLPPVEILTARARGDRITQGMITAWAKAAKADRKQRRKGRGKT